MSVVAIVGSPANASSRCDLKKVLEQGVRANLNRHVALSEITKISKQPDGSYYVEFAYVGEDYEDSGFFIFEVNEQTCIAKRK